MRPLPATMQRAKRPARLPVMLTTSETQNLLDHLADRSGWRPEKQSVIPAGHYTTDDDLMV
ncbi:hypothetical protein [Nitrosomonas sp. Nm51]|uniref:hypothetical protein n=1 Tax=Nitrosomonas sp. Nm51 TaxID=133720 RepID=UPI0015A57059|nr:hypothetical protein [Nitrosomonas sp. Nm51]